MSTAPSAISAAAVSDTLLASFAAARGADQPYRHWLLDNCLSPAMVDAALALPFPAPALGGVSGRREVHNATRRYFDVENRAKFPVAAALAEALQSDTVTRAVAKTFGAKLDGTYLRIEYAQDTDGFWLEPHTDLGVKLFTLLLALPDGRRQAGLGTDLYNPDRSWAKRLPFAWNAGLVFRPAEDTWHGFERRPIAGVRRSLIVNYVTPQWRDRDQLAFPDEPIAV